MKKSPPNSRARDGFAETREKKKKKDDGAMNLRISLSTLHAECEVLMWAIECMKTFDYLDVVFAPYYF